MLLLRHLPDWGLIAHGWNLSGRHATHHHRWLLVTTDHETDDQQHNATAHAEDTQAATTEQFSDEAAQFI